MLSLTEIVKLIYPLITLTVKALYYKKFKKKKNNKIKVKPNERSVNVIQYQNPVVNLYDQTALNNYASYSTTTQSADLEVSSNKEAPEGGEKKIRRR